MTANLSQDDVERLLKNPIDSTRAALATKVAGSFDGGSLTPDEQRIAEEIVRAMARDASAVVREALAVSLKSSAQLPHDVAMSLVQDVDRIAQHILESTQVLTEQDLIAVVRDSSSSPKQAAVARRSAVPEAVSQALIETDNAHVVATLMANDGAKVSEAGLNRVVDRFGDVEEIHTPLVQRAKLPVAIAERLVTLVSDKLQEHLVTHHELAPDTASALLMKTRERATVTLVTSETDAADVDRLVLQLKTNGRLTPSLILRALCTGDIRFFEASLAVLAGISSDNAHTLIHDAGGQGLTSLYQATRLPDGLLPVVGAALEIAGQTDFGGDDYDRNAYGRAMIERVLTRLDDSLSDEDADYLLAKLDDLIPAAA